MPDVTLPTLGGQANFDPNSVATRTGIHVNSNGDWFNLVYKLNHNSLDSTVSLDLYIDKSTNRGAAWTELSAVFRRTDFPSIARNIITVTSVIHTDDVIYVSASVSGATTLEVWVLRFDTASETWLSPLDPTAKKVEDMHAIVVKSTGVIHIAYVSWAVQAAPGGGGKRVVVYKEYSGGSWSTETAVPGQDATRRYYVQQLVLGASNRVHYFLNSIPLSSFADAFIHHVSYDGATWGTLQEITASTDRSNPFFLPFGLGTAYVDGSSVNKIAIPYLHNMQAESFIQLKVLVADDVANPTFSAYLIFDTGTTFGFGGITLLTTNVLASLVAESGTLYCWFQLVTGEDGSFNPINTEIRKTAFDGSAWSANSTFRAFAYPMAAVEAHAVSSHAVLITRIDKDLYASDRKNSTYHDFCFDVVAISACRYRAI